jgi:amino acid adenylation domain-containing protein
VLRLAADADLARVAARVRSTPTAVLFSALAVVLSRLTGQDDLLLGMPVARQAVDDRRELLGHCVQIVPVRLQGVARMSFRELVEAAHVAALDAAEHWDFTFGDLVAALGRSGDASRVPLLPVVCNVDAAAADLTFGTATARAVPLPRAFEAFELFLNALPNGGIWTIEATYQTALFDEASVVGWLEALQRVLILGASAPETMVARLPLVDAGSAAAAIVRGSSPLSPPSTWWGLCVAAARATPRATAVRDGVRSLDYAAFVAEVECVAHGLLAGGIAPGDTVAVMLPRSVASVVATAAVHRIGAVLLPLDPMLPSARLVHMLTDAGACRLLVAAPNAFPAGDIVPITLWEELSLAGERAIVGGAALPPLPAAVDAAYLLYTSGSTGVPKGVVVPHGALANALASFAESPGFGQGDTLLAVTTVSFDISLLELLMPLVVGGCVAVATRDEAQAPDLLAEALRRCGATVLQATPATWRMLLDDGWVGDPRLRAWCGGERLEPELAARLVPRVRELWNLYGPTETTIWSTVGRVADVSRAAELGAPIAATVVAVVDESDGPAPRGFAGELCIAGAGLAIGYHRDPQRTAERFVTLPGLGRVYRTGDRGRIGRDGRIECLGRLDGQIKLRGFRIETGEIAAALRALPGVRDAAVELRTVAGAPQLIGFVAADEVPAGWDGALRATLPDYMVPARLQAVATLPRLPNGKLDRARLQVADDGGATAPERAFVAPRDEAERLVAENMAELLGMARISVDDDFFACGGHSLLAAQLAASLNRRCGVGLTMRSVFEAPTPEAMAARLRQAAAVQVPIARRDDRSCAPVTPAQERMWYIEGLDPTFTGYNLPSAHLLVGPLDAGRLAAALAAVVANQPSLRTTFERGRDGLVQRIHAACPVAIPPVEDLSELPEAERERELHRRLDAAAVERFDLGALPLFATRLFRLAADRHVFFFMPHHMVWDGWSFDLLYDALDRAYSALSLGRAPDFPELPIDHGDFAAWRRGRRASPEHLAAVIALRERLDAFGAVAALPTDHARRPGMIGRGAAVWMDLDAARAAALHRCAKTFATTPFAVALAVFGATLAEFGGADRVLLAAPLRGRDGRAEESVMGCWNRLAPLPLAVDRTATFAALLEVVRKSVLAGWQSADVDLEELATERHAAGVLYQALFSYQDVRSRRTRWGDLEHRMIPLFQRGATEDLGLWFVENDRGLSGMLTYNAALLEPARIDALRRRYLELFDELLARPAVALSGILRRSEPATAPDVPTPRAPAAEVADDFEWILLQIWRELLGVPDLSIDDDVFACGANSLGAIRCVERFAALTGVQMQLGEVFRSPTPRTLAAALRNRDAKPAAMVIPLQPEGSQPPLLCLVGVQVYRNLARSLGPDQPVFGIYVPEEQAVLDGDESVALESIIEAYAAWIATLQLRGPLRLAGLSFAGVVALDVAKRLMQRGIEIDRVVLIDTILPSSVQARWWYRSARAVYRLGRSVFRGGSSVRGAGPGGQRPAQHALEFMDDEVDAWSRRFEPASCPVLLVRALDNPWGAGHCVQADYGWRSLLGANLAVVDVDGDHHGVLKPPRVDHTSAEIRNFLAAGVRHHPLVVDGVEL